jgi:cell division protein FtsZ
LKRFAFVFQKFYTNLMAKKIKKVLKIKKFLTEPERNKINLVRKLRGIQENKKFDRISNGVKKTRVRVIGIGGGGGNIVSEIASRIGKVSFVAANTDLQALKSIRRNVLRFPFGENFTHGLGTGMNPELAGEAAINEKEKIKKLFQGQDFCIIISTLGGGTGSGASPVFAKMAKSSGAITLGVFTLPFKFEGEKKQEIAKESLLKLRSILNAIAILPNDRIFQTIDKSTPLKEALSVMNKNLAESLEGLIEAIYLPGLINIDFADLKTILQGQGRFAYLNTVEIQGENRAIEGIKKVLNCPLYPYTIRGAKRVLFNITGERELSLSDVSQISKTIFEMVNPESKIIFGISQDKKYQDKIKVAILATGCGAKLFSENVKKTRKIRKKVVQEKALSQVRKIKKREEKKPESKTEPSDNRARGEKRTKFSAATKKVKVKVRVKREQPPPPAIEEKSEEGIEVQPAAIFEKGTEVKIRKNALQIKREAEEAEKEFLAKEEFWEIPTFLRKQQNK